MNDKIRKHRVLVSAGLVASALAGCGSSGSSTPAATQPSVSGVVVGSYFQNAKVCIDANDNGVCDTGETTTTTDAKGAFTLKGSGAIVAEIGTDATRLDPDTNTTTKVTSPIVFRAPAEANTVVSGLTTEIKAEMDLGAAFADARKKVAGRVGVAESDVVSDLNKAADAKTKSALKGENDDAIERIQDGIATMQTGDKMKDMLTGKLALSRIQNVVVIYAENRSFDNLYGTFPGANGVDRALADNRYQQVDLDGSTLSVLPPVWGGITSTVTQAMTANLPNKPFRIDDPAGFNIGLNVITRDLDHSFFFHQMQINGGKNDRFANASDAGGLVMGTYDGSVQKMWAKARNFTLADNFFMGAFGGSFLNHFWLVCACTPVYPNADTSVAKARVAAPGGSDGVTLQLDTSKGITSVLNANGRPPYLGNGSITPVNSRFDKFYAVNTMQPPYQPSGNKPAVGGDATLADPSAATTLPTQSATTIGDLLSGKGVSWAWYAGAWNDAVTDGTQDPTKARTIIYNGKTPNFQPHHQPFNYFTQFAPGTQARTDHLKDGSDLMTAITNGTLPQVVFYKPQGNQNQHAGYTDVVSGDAHISDVIDKLMASPQWKNMLVVVTYDEHGGWWDHVAPPKGDVFGPGSRIPALIISPYAKKGFVDHSLYDTTSILRFITRRFGLPHLAGLDSRQQAVFQNTGRHIGDLTNALNSSN